MQLIAICKTMKSKEMIKEKICELCSLDPNEADKEINLVKDIGYESIQIVKLILDIEKEFSIVFDVFDINVEDFMDLNNLINKVYDLVSEI